ncbi:hypothetical protein, partial [Fibrobacter sp. UBA3629]|uniref:hypothetical protein n=1 Tax=Fibrobacter sp. UBA3629 TaxID=1946530 RepID=UPI0025C66621
GPLLIAEILMPAQWPARHVKQDAPPEREALLYNGDPGTGAGMTGKKKSLAKARLFFKCVSRLLAGAQRD